MSADPLSFHVYPASRHSFYFTVNIWPTKTAMRQHCFWITGNFDAASTGLSTTRYPQARQTKEIGQVNFYRRSIGAGLVAHELLHSVIRWLQLLNLSEDSFHIKAGRASESEELMCGALHRMVIDFWDCYYRLPEYRVHGELK